MEYVHRVLFNRIHIFIKLFIINAFCWVLYLIYLLSSPGDRQNGMPLHEQSTYSGDITHAWLAVCCFTSDKSDKNGDEIVIYVSTYIRHPV